ncbi:MAG: tetratricopeptide repeat protein [Bacteroidales bacterium]|nr:tetratricopeptide repeat protein [Bacteroidales bacterium]
MMRRVLVIMMLVFVLVSCTNSHEKMRKELNYGIKELYKGDLTHAIQRFNIVIDMDSTNCEAHLYLGRAYFNQAKYDNAMKEYDAAIRHNPKYGEAFRSRAQLWFVFDNRLKSCEDYLKAESLGVKNLDNYTRHCK